jgi:signal transduction histidine kinase
VAVVAVVSAVAAFWITLRAGFLHYPAWLAVQKADLILGPVAVGLYWRHRRPHNRMGVLLIVLGLVSIPYTLESATAPVLFGVGVLSEAAIPFMTAVVILAFPNGRLDGVGERLALPAVVLNSVIGVAASLTDPHVSPGGSISGCRVACPRNGLAIFSVPSWMPQVDDFWAYLAAAIPLAIIGLYAWRWATAKPPRRRALSIGAPVALIFLVTQASYRILSLLAPNGLSPSVRPLQDWLQWAFAGARSFIWYGFLLALIAAQLFAGRALRRLVGDSLGRPSLRELEAILRGQLGDPGLRLGVWRPGSHDWADGGGEVLGPPESGQVLTEVERKGRPAAAIVHDEQFAEDPELLQAAGAVALLAREHAELEAGWKQSLGELADSRARLVSVGARERRKLERDLHDGAQQRLVTIQLGLRLAQERAEGDLADDLGALRAEAEEAVEELRTLAHGIYPTVLRESGLADALRSVAIRAPIPIRVTDAGIGRCSATVEAAIYFCSLEAVQNTIKHGGPQAHVTVTLGRDREAVHFAIADDGVGMDVTARGNGVGFVSMRDRIGAVGGDLVVLSSPGQGTTVRGTVPADGADSALEWIEGMP